MFGLTRREQRWTAEQQVAELIAGVAKAALLAKTEIAKADANAALSAALAKVEALEARVEQLSLPYTKMCEQVWELQEQRDSFQRVGISALDQRDQLAALLARCQEKLDCHRDAVLWGDVCAALAPACNTATKPVYLGFDLASGPDMTVYDCGQCPTSGGCLGCCMKAHAPGGL